MSSRVYYWKNDEVIESPSRVFEAKINDCPCVDDCYIDGPFRYGIYMHGRWKHIPIEEFPKEFRMHLLLMGVA